MDEVSTRTDPRLLQSVARRCHRGWLTPSWLGEPWMIPNMECPSRHRLASRKHRAQYVGPERVCRPAKVAATLWPVVAPPMQACRSAQASFSSGRRLDGGSMTLWKCVVASTRTWRAYSCSRIIALSCLRHIAFMHTSHKCADGIPIFTSI